MDNQELMKRLKMNKPLICGSKSVVGYTTEKKFICFAQHGNQIRILGDILPGNKLLLSVEAAYYAVQKNIAIAIFSDNPLEDLEKNDYKVCSEIWFLQKLTDANISIGKYNVFQRVVNEGFIIRPARPIAVYVKKFEDDMSPPLHDYDVWDVRCYDAVERECPPPKMRFAVIDKRFKTGKVDVHVLVHYMAQPPIVKPFIVLSSDSNPVGFGDLDGRFILPASQLKQKLRED